MFRTTTTGFSWISALLEKILCQERCAWSSWDMWYFCLVYF